MRFSDFVQHLVNAFSLGGIYALIAIGYTMVYGILRLINFAHGDIFTYAIYFAFYGVTLFMLPWWVSFITAIFFTAFLGALIERIAYRPLRNAPRKLESIITQISGIIAARVVSDTDGLKEIHVVADSAKNPKQIVRDVETAILASTGLRIDRKIVSVAQLNQEYQQVNEYRLESIKAEEVGKNLKVTVTVKHDDEIYEGSSEGPKTSLQRLRIAASAALKAVDELSSNVFSVDDVRIINLAGKDFVICHVTKLANDREKSIIGSAEIERDVLFAAANAALDAWKRA